MTLKNPYTNTPLTRCPYGDDCPAEQELKRLRKLVMQKYRDGQPVQPTFEEAIKKGQFHNG